MRKGQLIRRDVLAERTRPRERLRALARERGELLARTLIEVEKGSLAGELEQLLRPGEVRVLKRRLRGVLDPTWRFPEPTSAWSVPWPPV